MNRALCIALLVTFAGCTLPSERPAVKPLPEDSLPQTYADLLVRARAQATTATESFYINAWIELEDIGRSLEQTGRFLPKATDVPERQKESFVEKASSLESEAKQLQQAAKARDEKKANEILQRINLLVRELRSEG